MSAASPVPPPAPPPGAPTDGAAAAPPAPAAAGGSARPRPSAAGGEPRSANNGPSPPPPPFVPPPPVLNAAQESALKSALAVVVLRRRAKERREGRREDGAEGGASISGLYGGGFLGGVLAPLENDDGGRACGGEGEVGNDDEEDEGSEGGGDRRDCERRRRRRDRQLSRERHRRRRCGSADRSDGAASLSSSASTSTSTSSSRGAVSGTAYSSGGALLPAPAAPASVPTDRDHLRSMVRVAVSTAATLYDGAFDDEGAASLDVDRHGGGRERSGGGAPAPTAALARPAVYDYDACSLPHRALRQRCLRAHAVAASTAGGGRNEESNPGRVLSAYAVLDGLASHLSARFRSVLVRDGPSALDEILRDDILRPAALPPLGVGTGADGAAPSDEGDGNSGVDECGNRSSKQRARGILAACTLLHRVTYLDQNPAGAGGGSGGSRGVAMGVVRAACGALRELHDDAFATAAAGRRRGGSGPSPRRDADRTPSVREGGRAKESGNSGRCRRPDPADVLAVNLLYLLESASSLLLLSPSAPSPRSRGRVAESLLAEMRSRLGEELVVPLPARDMARFYRAERVRRMHGSKGENEAAASSGVRLGPEGKMMLRLCLFDVSRRLCAYCCTGDHGDG